MRLRSELPTIVMSDRLTLPRDLRYLHYVANLSYWTHKFDFKSCICERWKIFGGWQSAEIFSIRSWDLSKHYCRFPSLEVRYEPQIFSLLRSLFMAAYYSVGAMQGSVFDKSMTRKIPFSE